MIRVDGSYIISLHEIENIILNNINIILNLSWYDQEQITSDSRNKLFNTDWRIFWQLYRNCPANKRKTPSQTLMVCSPPIPLFAGLLNSKALSVIVMYSLMVLQTMSDYHPTDYHPLLGKRPYKSGDRRHFLIPNRSLSLRQYIVRETMTERAWELKGPANGGRADHVTHWAVCTNRLIALKKLFHYFFWKSFWFWAIAPD